KIGLLVKVSDGLESTYEMDTLTITAAPVASAGPDLLGQIGSPVTFAGAVNGGKSPHTYNWAFCGCGHATGRLTPSHTYAATGTYTAALTVTDSAGQTSNSSDTVTILTPPPVANAGPNETGDRGTLITFAGSASGGTAPLTYAWSFGDGGTATG